MVTTAALLFSAATAGAAGSPADTETARALFKEGNQLRDAGNDRGALEKYKVAYALAPTPIIALELGRAHERLKEYLEARQVLASIDQLPAKTNESEKTVAARREAKALSDQIAQKIPSLKINVSGATSTQGLEVTVDGESVPAAALEVPRRLNPGEHVVVGRLGRNAAPVTEKVTLTDGQAAEVTLQFGGGTQPVQPLPTLQPGQSTQPLQPTHAGQPLPAAQPVQPLPMAQTQSRQPAVMGPGGTDQRNTASPRLYADDDLRADGGVGRHPAKGERTHDGFYLQLGLGFGSAFGSYKYDPDNSVKVDFSGLTIPLEIALGGTPAPGLVIGGAMYGQASSPPSVTLKLSDGESLESTAGSRLDYLFAPFASFYPDPKQGLHFDGAIGLAMTLWDRGESKTVCDSSSCGTVSIPGTNYSGKGYGFMISGGYDAWVGEQWSVGGLARLMYTSTTLDPEDSDYRKIEMHQMTLGILGTATFH